MRNPAPVVLSLLLAVAAVFFLVKHKDAQPPEPPPAPAAEAAEPSPTETEAPPATEPAAEPELAAAPLRPWAHDASDIPPDPTATFGQLPNGLRYIIIPNAEPPGRVSLRLHIAAGSLMEAEDQRGLAHFLEHMVFNGSKNFTPDELIPRMQRLGVGFGAHVNAYTSFDETVYMLDLPQTNDEMLTLGYTVMRDFADGALLDTKEIDKERGVILSEKTSRDTVGYRLMQKQFNTLLPDSLIAKRFPIGEESVIKTAPRERFVDFYSGYYIPSRMTFVVVGDVKVPAMEKRITTAFGTMLDPETPGPAPDLGSISPPTGLQPAVFADKEVAATELGLLTLDPWTPIPDTTENRIIRMPLSIAHSILARRFERLAKEEGAPIVGGSASRQELFNILELGSIDVTVADDRWQDAVPVLEQEFRRALEFGFNNAELAEAKANLLNAYEQAVKAKETRKSDGLASAIIGTLNDQRVLTEPETDLEIIQAGLDQISPDDCHQAYVEFWQDKGMHLILTTKEEPIGAVRTLTSLFEESAETKLEAPLEADLGSFAHTDFGPPGEITGISVEDDLGITILKLSNGVSVHLKPTDFQKNAILVSASIGHGKLTQPGDKPGIDLFATQLITEGGIGDYSNDDLKQILAGRNVSYGAASGFSVADGAFTLGGQTTPDDLELQLQLMAAQIEMPGYREEAVDSLRKQIPMIYQQMKHTPAGAMQEMGAWLHGKDPRFVFPAESALAAYEIKDAKPWLESAFSKGVIELNLVGDFRVDTAIPLILKTFGALEARPEAPVADELRTVKFPNSPASRTFEYESEIPQGMAMVAWQTEGMRGHRKTFRRLNLVGDILGDRLREKIREELGASYSPNAQAGGSDALDNFGYILARNTCKPEDTAVLISTTTDLAAAFAEKGATADELERAREPTLAEIRKMQRDNSYWLAAVLSGLSKEPEKLDLARSLVEDYSTITLEEINELAAKYLAGENALQITIKPGE